MRTTIVTGALLTFTLLTATPALAAPEINQRSCEGSGGTFSREQGTKSCTTVTTTETAGATRVIEGAYRPDGFLSVLRYVGVSEQVVVEETTTTRTQKSNGPIASTSSSQTSSRYVHTCYENVYSFSSGLVSSEVVSPEPCQNEGLLL